MSKVTLTTLANLENETTAVNNINSNSSTISTAFDNTLSRDGTTPNAMNGNLDMNSFQILNLPAPLTANSPARLQDVAGTGSITVNALPTGGSTNAILHKSSGANYDATWTLTPTVTSLTTSGGNLTVSTPANGVVTPAIAFTGSVSGSISMIPQSSAGGTLTLPNATDTLIGKATTDTLTNKTYDTAGTGNTFKINGTAVSAVTGTGSVVLATTPTLTTPVIGAATGTSLTASGLIKSSSASAGIGYATGAGGTVTQITSRSTGVTVNKICGSITTFSGVALAAGSEAAFLVSNSSVASTDCVIVNIASGATTNAYICSVTSVGSGSFTINYSNVSAGALDEIIVFNFAVIKSVTS